MMALCRPIEIHATNRDFTVDVGGGAQARVVPVGVYGSILTALEELEDVIQGEANTSTVRLSTDWKVVISFSIDSSPVTTAVVWTDQALGRLLGFTGNLSGAASYTATYTPEYCWLPTYETSDAEQWEYKPKFSGATSVSGQLSGVALAGGRYDRTAEWPVEFDYNSKIMRATESFTWTSVYYPQQIRCLEQFVDDVKNAAPTADDADGLNMKGFYVIHCRSVYTGSTPTVAIPSSMDSGGVMTQLSSSPDRYVYCSLQSGSLPSMPLASDDQSIYRDCSMTLHTATAPTWNQP